MKLKALIVDDEPLARERLRNFLAADPDVEIVGECTNGSHAVEAVLAKSPDLTFLDVQMPVMDGFEVLDALGPRRTGVVIFVTAYDKYALRAFDAFALDYLLKPFDRPRFHRALLRAKTFLRQDHATEVNQRLLALIESLKTGGKYMQRLPIRESGRVLFLQAREIDYVEAAGNYVNLRIGKEAHLVRETMTHMESRLDPALFRRIHRSTIINLERIKELQPLFNGDYAVILRDGTRLTMSRTYRGKLDFALNKTAS